MRKKRDRDVDFLRGVLILLMIMGHIDLGAPFHHYIHMFHMPAWFFISGWFYKDNGDSLYEVIRKKARSLLVPYFLFSGIHLFFWYFLNRNTSMWVPLSSIFWINNDDCLPIAKALWFLTSLFFAEVIFIILKRSFRNRWILRGACAAVALTGNVLPMLVSHRLPWSLEAAFVGTGFVCLGEELRAHSSKPGVRRLLRIPVLPLFFLMILNGGLCFLNGEINMRTGTYRIIPLFWFNAVCAIILYWNAARSVNRRLMRNPATAAAGRALQSIGRDSLIYLGFNQLAIRVTLRLILRGTGYDRLPWTFRRALILFLVLLLIYAVRCLCGILRILKSLCGGGKSRQSYKPERPGRKKADPDRAGMGRILPGVLFILAILVLVPAGSVLMKRLHYRRVMDHTTVSVPRPADEAAFAGDIAKRSREEIGKYSEKEMLTLILRENLDYILDRQWVTPSVYAYCTSSNYNNAVPLTMQQAKKVDRSLQSFQEWEDQPHLYIVNTDEGKSSEQAIRPWAHACFTMANAVRYGAAGDRAEETRQKACLLAASLAKAHYSNSLRGWGYSWQSAEWAENIGYAAWLLWDDLSEEDRYYVINMVTSEADRFVDYKEPYYRDAEGRIISKGNTRAEENAWNSRILALASCMFPDADQHEKWESALIRLLLSSTAMPEDVGSERSVDGYILSEVLKGSNVDSDGTVVNHDRVHSDYMAVTMEGMLDTVLIYDLAGRDYPRAAISNFDQIYGALVNVDLGTFEEAKAGHHFYEREGDGVSAKINMPGENDWGGRWYPMYYLIDSSADLLGYDTLCPDHLKGADWAEPHLLESFKMNRRESLYKTVGQFFDRGENNVISGEMYQMQNVSKAAALKVQLEDN